MKHTRRFRKKGNFLTDNIGSFLLALAVALVGLYLIWAYLLHGVNPSSMNGCGQLTGSRGTCQISCDTNTEVEFENVGCKGKTNKCCVLKDDSITRTILPPPFGGTTEYNFEITDIRFNGDISSIGCDQEPAPDGDTSVTLRCPPMRSYRIPIAVVVSSTGTGPVEVLAVPVVIVSGNADTVRPPGTYVSKEKVDITSAQSAEAYVDVTLSATDSKEGNYVTIYPYAKCETRKCELADESRRGILSYSEEKYITVKFVRTTTP